MSIKSGGIPDIENMPPELRYNGVMVSDEIIWPLVNELVGYDYRAEAQPGDEIELLRRGRYQGRLLKAIASTDCVNIPINGVPDYMYVANLAVEEQVEDEVKGMMLSLARTALSEINTENEDDDEFDIFDEDVEDELVWPDDDDHTLTVMRGVKYSFHGDGTWDAFAYRSILGSTQRLKELPLCEAESQAARIDHLHARDIDAIEAGCVVFKATKLIIRAFGEVRQRPIETH